MTLLDGQVLFVLTFEPQKLHWNVVVKGNDYSFTAKSFSRVYPTQEGEQEVSTSGVVQNDGLVQVSVKDGDTEISTDIWNIGVNRADEDVTHEVKSVTATVFD